MAESTKPQNSASSVESRDQTSLQKLWHRRLCHRHPAQLSAAAAIKAVQTTMRDYRVRPELPDETLCSMLANALRDDYKRSSSKTSRDYPRKKQRKRIASPKIIHALNQQINAAKEVKTTQTKFQSAA